MHIRMILDSPSLNKQTSRPKHVRVDKGRKGLREIRNTLVRKKDEIQAQKQNTSQLYDAFNIVYGLQSPGSSPIVLTVQSF